jgi:hypothetical protein
MRDRSVKYRGHSNLFRDGKEVGPVPRLAIARDQRNEAMLLHCSRTWDVLGIAGYDSLRSAKLTESESIQESRSSGFKRAPPGGRQKRT